MLALVGLVGCPTTSGDPSLDAGSDAGENESDAGPQTTIRGCTLAMALDRLAIQVESDDRCVEIVLVHPMENDEEGLTLPESWALERAQEIEGDCPTPRTGMGEPASSVTGTIDFAMGADGSYPTVLSADVELTFGDDGGATSTFGFTVENLPLESCW